MMQMHMLCFPLTTCEMSLLRCIVTSNGGARCTVPRIRRGLALSYPAQCNLTGGVLRNIEQANE
jgi:hypothetical protein